MEHFKFDFDKELKRIIDKNIETIESMFTNSVSEKESPAELFGNMIGQTVTVSTEISKVLLKSYHEALLKYLSENGK